MLKTKNYIVGVTLAVLACVLSPIVRAGVSGPLAAPSAILPGEIFSHHVEVRIKPKMTETPVANFPMLVTVTESATLGFKFSDLTSPSDGADIRFLDENGNFLPFEIDTWEPNEKGIFWVRVPVLSPEGTSIYMWWGLKPGAKVPANDPTAIWSDYLGVWHMGDAEARSAKNVSPKGSEMNSTSCQGATVLPDGLIGAGKTITKEMFFPDYESMYHPGYALTVSGWFKLSDITSDNNLFSKGTYKNGDIPGVGWMFQYQNSSIINTTTGTNKNYRSIISSTLKYTSVSEYPLETWHYFTYTLSQNNKDGKDVKWSTFYLDGNVLWEGEGDTVCNEVFKVRGGGGDGGNGKRFDEVRVRAEVTPIEQIKAEYKQLSGVTFYTWEEAIDHYWERPPSITPYVLKVGSAIPKVDFGLDEKGNSAPGIIYRNLKTGEEWEGTSSVGGLEFPSRNERANYTATFVIDYDDGTTSLSNVVRFTVGGNDWAEDATPTMSKSAYLFGEEIDMPSGVDMYGTPATVDCTDDWGRHIEKPFYPGEYDVVCSTPETADHDGLKTRFHFSISPNFWSVEPSIVPTEIEMGKSDLATITLGVDALGKTGTVQYVSGSVTNETIPWAVGDYIAHFEVLSEDETLYASLVTNLPFKVLANRWMRRPFVYPSRWTEGTLPRMDRGLDTLSRAADQWVVTDLTLGTAVTNGALPTAKGSYKIVFTVLGTEKFDYTDALTYEQEFRVMGSETYEDLTGGESSATVAGRVLLANNDDFRGADAVHAVMDQAYWRTDATVRNVFWRHTAANPPEVPYTRLSAETMHMLEVTNAIASLCGATTIWRLKDVRIGTVYAGDQVDLGRNALPHSPSSYKNDYAKRTARATAAEGANIVLRNTLSAQVISPCYTNGIGTIFFDAVNAWTANADKGFAQIVVEVATNCLDQYTGQPNQKLPTDENLENANWQPVKLSGVRVKAGVLSELAPTQVLTLDEAQGGSDQNFFRVVAKVDCYTPARWRVRRVSIDAQDKPDGAAMILTDNYQISYPVMRCDLTSYGMMDGEKSGKATLGQEGAWNVPFPSVKDEAIWARARPIYHGNPGYAESDIAAHISAARLHYRWRYLNQVFYHDGRFVREDDGAWSVVYLDARNDFRAMAALDVPKQVGDIEYFYTLDLDLPAYSYFDYTGRALGTGAAATARLNTVTNRAEAALQDSQGTDWYVRLREGVSEIEAVNLIYREGGTSEESAETVLPMELTDSHTWRAYLPTTTNGAKVLEYRLEFLNRQEAGSKVWQTNTLKAFAREAAETVPASLFLEEDVDELLNWNTVTNDAKTGHLLFQVSDDSLTLSISHADYQNFNKWHDAKGRVFVGTSTYAEAGGHIAGVSSRTRETHETFKGWTAMAATNSFWVEEFTYSGKSMKTPEYEPFIDGAESTPNGWWANKGMWVYGRRHDKDSEHALQLEGRSQGYVEYSDSARVPQGLESVSFAARVAQVMDFESFSYYDGNGGRQMSDYTFATSVTTSYGSETNFNGDAAVSVVAYYKPNVGCYEFRVERAGSRKAELQLWKWMYEAGRLNSYKLGRWEFGENSSGDYATGTAATDGPFTVCTTDSPALPSLIDVSGNNVYGRLLISVKNGEDGTHIFGCLMRKGQASFASNYRETDQYFVVNFVDHGEEAFGGENFTSGTYGVLSRDCPAFFRAPRYYETTLNENLLVAGDRKESSTYRGFFYYTKSYELGYGEKDAVVAPTTDWSIQSGRMESFVDAGSVWGLLACQPSQEVIVSVSPVGQSNWTNIWTGTLTGFATEQKKAMLYLTTSNIVRIKTGGLANDLRTDVTLDDIVLSQFCGIDYTDAASYIPKESYITQDYQNSDVTNIIFTSATPQKDALLLSARRVMAGRASSVRSPFYDGYYGRSRGLGLFAFAYTNAQPNARLLLQIATNVNYRSSDDLNKPIEPRWQTLTTFTFVEEDQRTGWKSHYIGLHNVSGIMRLVVDPTLMEEVKNETDPSKFGEVTITEVICRDEPEIDSGSWWGWNIRAVGGDEDNMDKERMMYLPDATRGAEFGLSMALNNSVVDDIAELDFDAYPKNKPFVQTPIFKTEVIGEVSFKARVYNPIESEAYVSIYGSTNPESPEAEWAWLTDVLVDTTTYAAKTYQTALGANYSALRLCVNGVKNLAEGVDPGVNPAGAPRRVLLDEVVVGEAIRPRVAFRNVGAFRSDLEGTKAVPNVPSAAEQPICDEAWGVQCEVYADQLPDKIDLKRAPKVTLWWYKGDSPWGFKEWRHLTDGSTGHAELMATEDKPLTYRSSMSEKAKGNGGVMEPVLKPQSVVQYALEVEYWLKDTDEPRTNVLDATQWTTPAWYDPIDYNVSLGESAPEAFSAFAIFDTVAPNWAWINEVNILGGLVGPNTNKNTDLNKQFIEIAAPAEADLSNWRVRLLDYVDGAIVTNTLGIFGRDGLAATKAKGIDPDSGMVFHVLGSPTAYETLSRQSGELDYCWYSTSDRHRAFDANGYIIYNYPIGLQLVRPNGIIEHEIALMGTNTWASLGSDWEKYYTSTGLVETLNEKLNRRFFWPGDDEKGLAASAGVVNEKGRTREVWSNMMEMTPGRINQGQTISPDRPNPLGTKVRITCELDSKFGHITQAIGSDEYLDETVILWFTKKVGTATNINYRVAPWYVFDKVTLDGEPLAVKTVPGPETTYQISIGENLLSNGVLRAYAKPNDDLGLAEDNRYRPAILDWLDKHTNVRGETWADPNSGVFRPAVFLNRQDEVVTNLTLTQMYWLDMDPTLGTLGLKSYIKEGPSFVVRDGYEWFDGAKTNKTVNNPWIGIYTMITNRTEDVKDPDYGRAWPPYVIRGLAPGETSWDYDSSVSGEWNWTSVTFKVTGFLSNGKTNMRDFNDWVPLRYFVVNDESIPKQNEDDAFMSYIEVMDPLTPMSLAGWTDSLEEWRKTHGGGTPPVFFSSSLDERLIPISVETMKKENFYGSSPRAK